MLGCCAAIYWRLVERGHGQMALFVLLELSAFSRPSTLLATRRCDLVKPAKGSSRFWALLQHPQEESRPSRTQEIRRRLPPGLPPANLDFHVPTCGHRSAVAGVGTLYQLRHSGSSMDNSRQCRTLDAVQKKRCLVTGKKHAQVRTQQTTHSRLRKTSSGSPKMTRNMRRTGSGNHAGIAASCAPNSTRTDMMREVISA